MQIINLKLQNFRNYNTLELSFSKNNIIYGKNGMGKTNLIEAIYVLALTKTFRSNNEKIVINENSESTIIKGTIIDDIKNNYEVSINKTGKQVKIDNNIYKKISDYISNIKVILFNPNDLQIIKDSPSIRRKLLNVSISQYNNRYLKILSNYNKLLKQRNSYLKTMYVNGTTSKEYLDILTDKLIDLGLEIYEYRNNYINNINYKINNIYKTISNIDGLNIEYLSDYKDISKEKLLKKYKDNLDRDMILGMTKYGIHHDDLIFKIKDNELKEYGSEGQQKNAIISYKLSEIGVFKEKINKVPILILDDLFSELDVEKINNILNIIDDDVQTFITTTEIDKIKEELRLKSKIFNVTEDGIREEK